MRDLRDKIGVYMENLEQENKELKDEIARLTSMMESVLAA